MRIVTVIALLLAASCAPAPSEGAPCNQDDDCDLAEACESGRCQATAASPARDAGLEAVVDAGSDPIDSGPEPTIDGGPEPTIDSGPEPEMDSGPEPEIEGGPAPEIDSGPELAPDAGQETGLDAGPDPDVDAGQDAGPDAGPCSVDADCAASALAPLCDANGVCVAQLAFRYETDLDECTPLTGAGPSVCTQGIIADLSDGTFGEVEVRSYLRFPLDQRLANRRVSALRLRLNSTGDESNETGEIWLVEPFTRDSLDDATPTGLARLATSQGALVAFTAVTFHLNVTSAAPQLTPSGALHVELRPVSTDGVGYYDQDTDFAPMLEVTVNGVD